jgi:heme-degrading monooxygenase HmoA
MISRHWRAIVKESDAESYIAHLRNETFPQLSAISGFHAASILRRAVEGGIEFLIVTRWESIAAIREFAGENPEVAVVPEKAQAMMVRYDRTVAHYEVVE